MFFILLIALGLFLIGAPFGWFPSSEATCVCEAGVYGFWGGFFHGFMILYTFIGSFFYDMGVYEPCNSGSWYNAGYLLGVYLAFGSSSWRKGD